ncbi:ion transporter [Humidisolicoccus flavus]|uniref:ion transporter n=1 Tax=Humidisolicoccus flavus TaxID=3111414 RepID=UPI00324F8FFB
MPSETSRLQSSQNAGSSLKEQGPQEAPFERLSLRAKTRRFVEHRMFQGSIIALILINAVILGVETTPNLDPELVSFLAMCNVVIVAIFTVEIVLRLFAHGREFFKDGWSWFDLIIVIISLIPASQGTGILRVLRVLRVLRLMSSVPAMRNVVGALVRAVPGIGAIGGLLVMIMYVFAVACTMLFGPVLPAHFGDLGATSISLFRLLNGDGWGELVAPLQEQVPYAWPFMMLYGVISTFVILNLFIAVTCEALDRQKDEHRDPTPVEQQMMREIASLRETIESFAQQQEPARHEASHILAEENPKQ